MPAALAFTPLFMERVWGGRTLEERFAKELPAEGRIGESWELVDRPEAQSVVARGPLAGKELHALWSGPDRERLFGSRASRAGERCPLLVKLLDARETLSVQVHPPAQMAEELGGEPKTEMWFVAAAEPGAHLFAGLRDGVSQERFAAAQEAGEDVSGLLHRIDVEVGDALLIPSGRVHSLGAGCLVVEVQQNSDTTYRVYDFDRPGADGEPRELHIPESLACIDFSDVEPALRRATDEGPIFVTDHFTVSRRNLGSAPTVLTAEGECALVCVLEAAVTCGEERYGPGSFFLLPAHEGGQLPVTGPGSVLVVELP